MYIHDAYSGKERALKKTSGCIPQINCEELNLVSGELSGVALMPKKPSVLMHACCGPCSTSCVERTAADYALTLYYYNPNNYLIYFSFSPPLHLILPLELISLKDFPIITKLNNLHSQLF